MVVYHYEANCQAEKTGHYRQCQGHSEGLYNQNMTISTISSKLLARLQSYYKPECPAVKLGYCVHGQSHRQTDRKTE